MLRNRIVAPRMQRMALQDSLDGKPHPPNGSVFFDRFNGVVRAGRMKPTAIGKQRRKHPLINTDRESQYLAKHASILPSNVALDN